MEDILSKIDVMENQGRSGYKRTKFGWIPEDWELKKIGDLVKKIEGGGTPSKNNDEYWNGNIPWASVKDISRHNPSYTKNKITKRGLEESSAKLIPAGTLITSTRMLVGKAVIFKIDVAINQDLKAIYTRNELIPKFLFYHFEKNKSRILQLASGSTVQGIQVNTLKKIQINLPKLSEQERILGLLETWDDTIEKIIKLLFQKKLCKQGLMQQLLSGKKRLPGFSGEWKEYKLECFFNERNDKGYTDLRLLSVGEAGVYPQSDSNKKDTSNKDKSKYKRICSGDIGYNTMRLWQGRNALSQLEGIISPAYTVITPKENAHAEFFKYLFKLPEVVHKFYRNSQGLVSDTLNCKFKDFKIVKVLLPPTLDEQIAIANILQSSDKEINLLKKKKELLQNQKKGLMQQLLTGKKRVV